MGEILNLRQARKRAARRQDGETAAANRLKFGRRKDDRALSAAQSGKAHRDLDAHRIGHGEIINEIAGHQALHRHRRPQDKRQS
jgi:hypothetical protein